MVVLLVMVFVCLVPVAANGQPLPELPKASVETGPAPEGGRTVAVPAGGDFQAALHQAQPGDVITLAAGATYTGPFVLPSKSGSGWITVRTSAPDQRLPALGVRIDPSHGPLMPAVVAASDSVIATAPGAHHFRFVGIEIRPQARHFLYNLVLLGANARTASDLPHDIIFDRCYVHGDPQKGTRRGLALNARSVAVINSYLSDFKEAGADSQAIAAWNGPGPFQIVNNYLEAAGENVLFGGADPTIRDLVPSDIEIRRNHFSKSLSWRIGHPAYAGTPWTVKNLLELKNARRVLVEANVFEQNWGHAQTGFSILFTVRNQDGTAPWSVVEDVTFRRNIVRHTGSGVNILGRDQNPSQQTKRILITDNLFDDVNGGRWQGEGRLFQVLGGTADVVIEHNTGFQTGPIMMADSDTNTGFVYRSNITNKGNYGFFGSGVGEGIAALNRYFPGYHFLRNIIIGGLASAYPRDNSFPPSIDAVAFRDPLNGDYRLAASSRYRNTGTDGRDPGADLEALLTETAGVSQSR
jgi:hypothetical protein